MLLRTQLPALILALGLASACSPLRVQPVKDGNSVAHYPGHGGLIISNVRVKGTDKVICVAPPAQGALLQHTETKKRGKVGVTDYVEIQSEFDHSTIDSLARLYEQNERTLFLQYSLYRLCEAYMNDMLTPTSAATILREQARDQRKRAIAIAQAQNECAALDTKIQEMNAQEPKPEGVQSLVREREGLACDQLATEKGAAEAKALELEQSAKAAEKSGATYDAPSLYWQGFGLIMETAVHLAKVDADAAKLRAEAQAANAEKKAKEAEEKAKTAEAKAKAATETLETLRTKALDDTLERAKCRDCKVENADKSGPGDGNGKTND